MEDPCNTAASEPLTFWRKLLNDLFLCRKSFWILTLLIFAADLGSKQVAISFIQEKTQLGQLDQGRYYWIADR